MKKLVLVLSLFIFGGTVLNAQTTYNESEIMRLPLKGELKINERTEDWSSFVYNLESPFPGSNSAKNFLMQQKALIPQGVYINKKSTNGDSDEPILQSSYRANPFNGIPNDNDMAISNDGMIVSVSNSVLYIYHEDSDSIWQDYSLDVFADSLSLPSNTYDPRVEYDAADDRFIVFFLNGSDANATAIGVGFSKTNNPIDGWNLYAIPGNPLDDNAWSDFPAIAINENEVFLTINHINSDSVSWQTGFMRSIVWQIEKKGGYSGDSLVTKLYSNIKYNGRFIRNLLPIKGGEGPKGPYMYFMSNRNFSAVNDTFFLVKISDELKNETDISLTTSAIISSSAYGIPPNANQPMGNQLATNDSRPLGGFIENNFIHFVGNTVHPTTNLAAIYHGIYNVTTETYLCDIEILGGEDMEYGYPNISFSGQGFNHNQAIIGFNHSSVDSLAGISAIFYSAADGYSDRKHIVSGDTHIGLLSGVQRWGDYTGNQRRYNIPGEVWMNGLYSRYRSVAIGGLNRSHDTWIAKLHSPDTAFIPSAISAIDNNSFETFPNPTSALFQVKFENPNKEFLQFELFDLSGKMVKSLLSTTVKSGTNLFQFSMEYLNQGQYILSIKNANNELIHSTKVFKE